MNHRGHKRCDVRLFGAFANRLVVLAAAGSLGAAEPNPADSLAIAGSDRILWIAAGEWDVDQQHFLNGIAWMDPATMTLRALPLPAQYGQARCWAEWDGALHVFSTVVSEDPATVVHRSYARPGEVRPERRLPGEALPVALAGGSTELPGLWAVVDDPTGRQVRKEWEEYQRSQQTQPAEDDEAKDGKAEDRPRPASPDLTVSSRPVEGPAEGFCLVVYDGINWRPGFEAPPGLTRAARVWLTVSGERQHLFWQVSVMDEVIHYARRGPEEWTNTPPLRFDRPVQGGFAGVLNRQLIFAALLEDESGSGLRCVPRVLVPTAAGQWCEQPALGQADGQVLVLPKGSLVGSFRDMLALLRHGENGPEVGLWSPTKGRAALPFAPVPVRKGEASPGRPGPWEEMISLLVVGAIVLLVYWRRRDSFASPVVLPPGLAAADLGRRGLAAAIDMAPAAVVAGLIWRAPLAEYLAAWNAGIEAQETAPPEAQGLAWAWVCFALVYTGWCTAFELFVSASPGKRLLGCSVLSESLERPARWQIVVRNATRLIELLPRLQVWPFLLLVVMTRNRQRVGDLLARTVVVEGAKGAKDAREIEPQRRKDAENDEEE